MISSFWVRTQPTWGLGEARPMVSVARVRARCMKALSGAWGDISSSSLAPTLSLWPILRITFILLFLLVQLWRNGKGKSLCQAKDDGFLMDQGRGVGEDLWTIVQFMDYSASL